MQKTAKTAKYFMLFWAFFALLSPSFVLAYEAAPYASTMQPTFVTEKSAQLNGRVNPNEMKDTYEWFEWGISGRSEIYQTPHRQARSSGSQVTTRATIIGLAPSTQYFYRQIAENSRGKSIGATGYITTKPLAEATQPIVIVATNNATFITETGATLRGYVSPHGSHDTKTWFEWGPTGAMGYQTSYRSRNSNGTSGTVEEKLQGLMSGTPYYFRIVAETVQGRSYGVMQVFVTAGSPPLLSTETPRAQYVSSPVSSSYGGAPQNQTTVTGSETISETQPQDSNLPGDFRSLLKKKNSTNVTNAGSASQVAGVGASRGLFDDSGMLTGKKDVEVAIGKIGPENVTPHTPVEYRIAYAYHRSATATDAKLRITLPGEVIYIGDNTNNELLIEAGSGSERTYILPLGDIAFGSTRTISLLGMTTADANGFPDIAVELNYTDKQGVHVVGAVSGIVVDANDKKDGKNAASVGSTGSKLIPSSPLGWIAYILVVILGIIGVLKAKQLYIKKKEALAEAEAEEKTKKESVSVAQNNSPQSLDLLPGKEEITAQVA